VRTTDHRSDSEASRLTALLAPVAVDEFLARYWQRQFLFSRGAPDRFAGLISWPDINRILEHHWRETFRFRLTCQGRDLDPASYADLDRVPPYIRARDLTDHLRRGATLAFNAIDEVHEPLARLARAFEAIVCGGIQINMYAAWRSVHGLDLHRDDQEIVILHVDGRKRWLLYGASVDGVDRGGLDRGSEPPRGAEFDEILRSGDLLYIPRGCYHVAVPVNEPALHLTISIKNPGAMDLKPRPSFNLPWSATADGLPPDREFFITLAPRARLVANDGVNAPAAVECGAHTYRFPGVIRWVIDQLDGGEPMSMTRLIDSLGDRLDETAVRTLVGMLANHDLVSITV
jgi:cupin superfamily protein